MVGREQQVEIERPGTLYLVGTPIGNLGDITIRALEVLKAVDLIAAEDTRHTRKLLAHYGIKKPLTSYHEHNKWVQGRFILERLKEGEKVALVSDAGMPGISDPGADLVLQCLKEGISLTVIPGPSALLTALVASGLDTSSFVFGGFFPRQKKKREILLKELAAEKRTLVFYESPHRLKETLKAIRQAWGNRRCCIARELTKVFEEYRRGTLEEIEEDLGENVLKGEITLVVEGKDVTQEETPSWEVIMGYVAKGLEEGLKGKEAAKAAAKKFGVPTREVYKRIFTGKEEK
jgi:16S rRNA (cytidine1402-2'-O)-methyltransferase